MTSQQFNFILKNTPQYLNTPFYISYDIINNINITCCKESQYDKNRIHIEYNKNGTDGEKLEYTMNEEAKISPLFTFKNI